MYIDAAETIELEYAGGPYLWPVSIDALNRMTDVLFANAEVVEINCLQPDGTMPVIVDGVYVGNAIALVGVATAIGESELEFT